jgi:hypothetical protein
MHHDDYRNLVEFKGFQILRWSKDEYNLLSELMECFDVLG